MTYSFTIGPNPVKRGKAWVIQIFNIRNQLDSEMHFKLKRDAQGFINGWHECVEANTRYVPPLT